MWGAGLSITSRLPGALEPALAAGVALATARKTPRSWHQQTLLQLWSAVLLRLLQWLPSLLVITRLPLLLPLAATATKRWRWGLQQTALQPWPAAAVLRVQWRASWLVITRSLLLVPPPLLPVPVLLATATKRRCSGLQQIALQP
jgi:hypothetical protein